MVRGRPRALVGQGRLGLGREVAPFSIPQPTPVRHTEAPQHHEPLKLLLEWHQRNNTWGTNPSSRQDGSPMPRGAWTGEQGEHLDALRPSQGAQGTQRDGTGRESRGRELQVLLLLHLQHGEAPADSVLQYFGVFSMCKCAAGNGHRHFGHSPALLALLVSWAWTRVMVTERNLKK